jgi:hypothetical protein
MQIPAGFAFVSPRQAACMQGVSGTNITLRCAFTQQMEGTNYWTVVKAKKKQYLFEVRMGAGLWLAYGYECAQNKTDTLWEPSFIHMPVYLLQVFVAPNGEVSVISSSQISAAVANKACKSGPGFSLGPFPAPGPDAGPDPDRPNRQRDASAPSGAAGMLIGASFGGLLAMVLTLAL